MQILTLVLSALAFLMGAGTLILVLQERKHLRKHVQELNLSINKRFRGIAAGNQKSRAALLQHVDEAEKRTAAAAEKLVKDVNGRVDKANQALRAVGCAVKKNMARIDDLEHGVVPDFEAARKAVNAVNDINKGISGILGFDPLEALKQSRQEGD